MKIMDRWRSRSGHQQLEFWEGGLCSGIRVLGFTDVQPLRVRVFSGDATPESVGIVVKPAPLPDSGAGVSQSGRKKGKE